MILKRFINISESIGAESIIPVIGMEISTLEIQEIMIENFNQEKYREILEDCILSNRNTKVDLRNIVKLFGGLTYALCFCVQQWRSQDAFSSSTPERFLCHEHPFFMEFDEGENLHSFPSNRHGIQESRLRSYPGRG